LKRKKEAAAQSLRRAHGQSSIALQPFCSMHIEAMNFSGVADAEPTAVLVSQRICCAFCAIAWNNVASNRRALPASSKCSGAIKQRC
jgi:hypothetical protein